MCAAAHRAWNKYGLLRLVPLISEPLVSGLCRISPHRCHRDTLCERRPCFGAMEVEHISLKALVTKLGRSGSLVLFLFAQSFHMLAASTSAAFAY
jgi:hypothetical protein